MQQRPSVLAIVGDSAAGKSTLAAGITALLGPERVVTLRLDDYHRFSRVERHARGLTPLHPDCNDLEAMEADLARLAAGLAICKPVYNHLTGTSDAHQELRPAPFVISEGLLGLATPALRERAHIKLFLDPPEPLRERWKLRRDTVQRGYSPEQVRAEIARRRSDGAEFIRPQRGWADLVVRFVPAGEALDARIYLRSSLSYPDLSHAIAHQSRPPAVRLRVGRDEGRLTEILEIDGRLSAAQLGAIRAQLWERLPVLGGEALEQLGRYHDGDIPGQSHPLALIQLLVTAQLLQVGAGPAAASGVL